MSVPERELLRTNHDKTAPLSTTTLFQSIENFFLKLNCSTKKWTFEDLGMLNLHLE